jgi:hypothetical protein
MVSTDASEDIISRIIEDFKICQEHYPNGCNWGDCNKCGVPLAYHKLVTGETVERNVQELREKIIREGIDIKDGSNARKLKFIVEIKEDSWPLYEFYLKELGMSLSEFIEYQLKSDIQCFISKDMTEIDLPIHDRLVEIPKPLQEIARKVVAGGEDDEK